MSSSDVSSVTSHFSVAAEGFITTTSGSISSGAATVPLNSTSGLTNGNVFVGLIEPGTSGKEQTFTGIVDTSGAQITGVVWTRGSNTSHAAGVSVVDYVSGTAHNMATKGFLVEHSQDGTHGNITPDSVTTPTLTVTSGTTLPAGDIVTADIASGNVMPIHLDATQSASTWAWASYTPAFANTTLGNGTVSGKYIQVGKTVYFRAVFTLGSTSAVASNPTVTLPVTSLAYDVAHPLGQATSYDASGTAFVQGEISWATTTTALLNYSATTYTGGFTSTVPFTWATSDKILIAGSYEAA